MNISSVKFVLVFSLLLPASVGWAETRYISDQLVVNLRSATGDAYTSLENLPTDAPVQVLQDLGAFIQVKTEKGLTGYIPSQYVSKNIPKQLQINKLTQQLTALQAQLEKERLQYQQKMQQANSDLGNISAITDDLKQTKLELEKVSSDYKSLRESSDDVVNLMATYEAQTEENFRLSNELAVLQKENNNFHRTNMVQWFLAGGAVFFFGWLIGKISRRKRGFTRF